MWFIILSLWLNLKTSVVHCLIDIIKATVHLVVHESLCRIAVLHRCGLLLKMVLLYVIIFIFLICFLVNILDVWFLLLCLSVTAVSPAKTSEPIEMRSLGYWVGRVQGTMYFMRCTLSQPGEYDWTVLVWQQCSLMSNYFDRSLVLY